MSFSSHYLWSMAVIEKLTPEQEQDLIKWREDWYRVGIDTSLADRETAQEAICEMYKRISMSIPEFVWCSSPKDAMEKIRKAGEDPNEALNNCFYGQQECYFEAFYLFCEKIGVKYKKEDSELLRIWESISKSCNWWVPYDTHCFICDKAEIVSMNSQMRIHSETGPAVKYRDGFAIYAINGVVVPSFVVDNPEKITVQMIASEQNAELRRIMTNRYVGGIGKYLSDSGAKLLDADTLQIPGSATRALMEDKNGDHWLCGSDGSTKRVYFMSVPRNANTCKEAHNMICGFDESRIKAEA